MDFDFDNLNMSALGLSIFFVLIELYFIIEDPLSVGWNKMGIVFMILFPLISLPLFYIVINRGED